MIDQIDKRIRRAMAGFRGAYRAILTAVSTAGPTMISQGEGLAGENLKNAEVVQHFGFTSVPPIGSSQIVLPLGGDTTHSIVICTEHAQYRMKGLASGEVAIYSAEDGSGGCHIKLKHGRIIEIICAELRITGEVSITGGVTVSQDVVASGKSLAHHTHGNVQPGSGTSGEPL